MASAQRLAVLLNKASVIACCAYIILRTISPGLDLAEPESAFLGGVSFFAFFCTILCNLSGGVLPLLRTRILIPLAALIIMTALAIITAATGGNLQLAIDLGYTWLSDLMIFIAVAITGSDKNARRLYISTFIASVALACAYGIYQRFYAIDYLRRVYESGGGAYANNQQMAKGMAIRLGSDRVSGPYSYANALATVCALALPLLWYRAIHTAAKRFLVCVICAVILCGLIFCESKAGIGAIILIQLITLFILAYRKRKKIDHAFATAGWYCASIILCAAIAAGVFYLSNKTGASIALALLWSAVMCYLPQRLIDMTNTNFRRAGLALIAVMILGIVGSGVLLAQSNNSKSESIRSAITMHAGVRLNYWKAAIDMSADHPLSGAGLDNFGERYSQYKQPQGWEVRRAHNHYLQLAADGGVLLLIAYIVFICMCLFSRSYETGSKLRQPIHSDIFYLATGIVCFAAVYAITYTLYLGGAFTGLGFEFFGSEMQGGAGSVIKESGSHLALFIHGLVNFAALPLIYILSFILIYKNEPEKTAPLFFKVAIIAVLIHGFFDFTLYHAAVSGLFFVMLALCVTNMVKPVTLKHTTSRIILAIAIIVGLVTFSRYLRPRLESAIDLCIADKTMMGAADYKSLEAAYNLYSKALEQRPADSMATLRRAEIMLRARHVNPVFTAQIILSEFSKAASLAPYSTAPLLAKATALQVLYPSSDQQANAEIIKLLTQTVQLYPLKPQHRLKLALAYSKAGQKKEAAEQFKKSITLTQSNSDERARLSPIELEIAQKWLKENRVE